LPRLPTARRTRFLERLMFWAFRLATYFVLACATYIFLDIGIKGSRTVFTSHAPFINLTFLSQPAADRFTF
jgi:phosphate transport system permease protein